MTGLAENAPADSEPAEPDLVLIPGFPFGVMCSPSVEPRARYVAERCAAAYRFLGGLLAFDPDVTLLVYSEDDWPDCHQPYGLPYFEGSDLVVAGGDAGFWHRFVPPLRATRPDLLERAMAVYGEDLDLGPFFDLLAVHELGHGFAAGHQVEFPRRWLSELFANLCLHAYVADADPESLPILATFPNAFVAVDPAQFECHTLAEFERIYSGMEGVNYGWYQCHLHVAARRLHEAHGTASLERLWSRFALPDPELVDILDCDVDPEVARILTSWSPPPPARTPAARP